MSILRLLYLKRNQLILFAFILSGATFLIFDAIYRGTWECHDKKSEPYYDSKGKYLILYNYVTAKKRFRCERAVTYCTHADINNLDSVRAITRSYDGPISIAVYCPGKDFIKAAEIIAHLRICYPEVWTLVTFHMVFDVDNFPMGAAIPLFKSYREELVCNPIQKYNDSDVTEKNLAYPINLLRNIARDGSNTYFILSVDLPLLPPADFSSNFMRMIGRIYGGILKSYHPSVFVLPTFVIYENVPIPTNKSMLANILIKGDGDVYQHLECSECHTVPEMSYKKWLQKGDYHNLGVAFVAKRSIGWQPFFVGTHSDPKFDERYLWKGIKDRQSQMYSMCTENYNFLVLDNAYLIYRETSKGIVDNEREIQNYLLLLDRDFIMIFGANEKCYLPKSETNRK